MGTIVDYGAYNLTIKSKSILTNEKKNLKYVPLHLLPLNPFGVTSTKSWHVVIERCPSQGGIEEKMN